MPLVIDYCPLPYQAEFHLSSSRFNIIAGGRRVGKSLACLHAAIAHCLSTPEAVCWWVSPTLGDAREVGFEEFKKNLDVLSPAISYINETRMKIGFRNGSVLVFKSSESENSLRGRGLTMVVIDEAAFISPSVWKKILRPALSDRQGRAILCSTPNGRNWFHQQYEDAGQRTKMSWSRYHWPTNLNPLITADDLADAQRELSSIDYRQEYLAEFITRAGLVFDDFSENNILSSFKLESFHDIYLGMDFGFAGYTAVCFMAVDSRIGTVTQFDEILVSRTDIDRVINQIKERKLSIKAIYCDPAGNAEELTSGISPVDTLRKAKFEVINRASSIAPGLALVRSFIKAADGSIKFFVTPNCTNTLKSLETYSYKMVKATELVKEEPDKDGFSDHMCDAIRYFFVNRFDKSKYVVDKVDTYNYLQVETNPRKTIMKRCGLCHSLFPSKTPKGKPPLICNTCLSKTSRKTTATAGDNN